jgi:hypothetical protein
VNGGWRSHSGFLVPGCRTLCYLCYLLFKSEPDPRRMRSYRNRKQPVATTRAAAPAPLWESRDLNRSQQRERRMAVPFKPSGTGLRTDRMLGPSFFCLMEAVIGDLMLRFLRCLLFKCLRLRFDQDHTVIENNQLQQPVRRPRRFGFWEGLDLNRSQQSERRVAVQFRLSGTGLRIDRMLGSPFFV